MRRRSLAVVAGVVVALGAGELLARVMGLGSDLTQTQAQNLELVEAHPELAQAARRAPQVVLDEHLGVRPVLGGAHYDLHGALRNAHPKERAPGTARWLFLGDSVTRRGHILKGLWRQGSLEHPDWRQTEWWNAAVESYSFAQSVGYFDLYCTGIEPTRVIFTIHNNDLTSTPISFRDEQGRIVLHAHGSGAIATNPTLLRWSHMARALALAAIRRGTDGSGVEREAREAFGRLLQLAKDQGFELTLVLLPYLAKPSHWGEPQRRSREFFMQLLEEHQVRWFDLLPALEEAIAAGVELHEAPGDRHHPGPELGAVFARHLLGAGFP